MLRRMHALCCDRFGGPEVLSLRELADPTPDAGQVLIRTRAIGLNYADVYRREGHSHLEGQPPFIAGYEAAGEVVAVGHGVTLVRAPVDAVIPLPALVSYDLAAAG